MAIGGAGIFFSWIMLADLLLAQEGVSRMALRTRGSVQVVATEMRDRRPPCGTG